MHTEPHPRPSENASTKTLNDLEKIMGKPDYKTIMADLETIVCDYYLIGSEFLQKGNRLTLRFRIYSDGRIEREVI